MRIFAGWIVKSTLSNLYGSAGYKDDDGCCWDVVEVVVVETSPIVVVGGSDVMVVAVGGVGNDDNISLCASAKVGVVVTS